MSPPSSIAWRTLEAETTPVAVRMRPARTRTALDRSAAAANGSAMAALPGVRDDRRELRGDGDAEQYPLTPTLIGPYALAALLNALLSLWIAHFIGRGEMRFGLLLALGEVGDP